MKVAKLNVELIAHTPAPDVLADTAASICVNKEPNGKSLGHAIKSGHDSVLEHVSFTFRISGISRACSHQLVRHRLASYSQKSQRYVKEYDFEYIVPPTISDQSASFVDYIWFMDKLKEIYNHLLAQGVPAEDARYLLPNACSTDLIMTMNARELRHFFKLRCCNRAQWEIRDLANKMLELCRDVAPTLFEDAGPSCLTSHCTEARPCGNPPKKTKMDDMR